MTKYLRTLCVCIYRIDIDYVIVVYFRLKTAETKLEEAIKNTAAEVEQWVS